MSVDKNALTFLDATNAEYIADLYRRYLENPADVDAKWQSFFKELNDNENGILKELLGASWTPSQNRKAIFRKDPVNDDAPKADKKKDGAKAAPAAAANPEAALDSLRAARLIRAYQDFGHFKAQLDPLGLRPTPNHPQLDPAFYGFAPTDDGRTIQLGGLLGYEAATLSEIVSKCEALYCRTVGVEFSQIQNAEERAWCESTWEAMALGALPAGERRQALSDLTTAELFEMFLHTKFTGAKRFGVDGGETVISAIEAIIRRGAAQGVNEVAIGLAHRGRLNTLTNVCGKPYTALFAEFQGNSSLPEGTPGSGDVKYHMGYSVDRDFDGNQVHVSMSFNPSHLEFVNPVTVGKARAKLVQKGQLGQKTILPLLIHGDAAFAGQGIVPEGLMMSELKGYRTEGSVHIIINNQIGFTTLPFDSRSGPYSSDIAKMLGCPIIHVNGEDADAVVRVAHFAIDYRQRFGRDVVVDLICYRRYGHNEGDEPLFTQPLMYQTIRAKKSLRTIYAERLVSEGVVSQDEADKMAQAAQSKLEEAFEATKSYKPNKAPWLDGLWSSYTWKSAEAKGSATAVPEKRLKEIGELLTSVPAEFGLNSKIARQLDAKKEMFKSGEGFDWATGEALAFGTLLQDGYGVRLSGQDCERGTFSHRHAVMYDQNNASTYTPLHHVAADQPKFEVYNSPLSEAAVLGFEYGYSLAEPKTLVAWEGQFGDFANGAQVLIDQFIASGETKWLRMSGLVMLLPHGFEGQGPEHSSARLERFLQLCAEDNMRVCNITTPANYFHALRRQMVVNTRKPLIVMSPKSLLRHKSAVSQLADFSGKTGFLPVIADDSVKASNVKRVVLCSGKVYYDLLEARDAAKDTSVALVRVEQLYPFPAKEIAEAIKAYKNAEIIWCQEEPKNQGAWWFIDPLLEEVLVSLKGKYTRARYAGRPSAAAPACGSLKLHQAQQAKLVEDALKG